GGRTSLLSVTRPDDAWPQRRSGVSASLTSRYQGHRGCLGQELLIGRQRDGVPHQIQDLQGTGFIHGAEFGPRNVEKLSLMDDRDRRWQERRPSAYLKEWSERISQ